MKSELINMTWAWDKKKLESWQESNPWPPEHWAGTLLSYENSLRARSLSWVHMCQVSCILLGSALSKSLREVIARWSGDVMKRPGHKNFNAVSHNRSGPEVLFLNLTWRSWEQISSVQLQFLLFAFSNRKFGRHGKWSVTFWQWESNT